MAKQKVVFLVTGVNRYQNIYFVEFVAKISGYIGTIWGVELYYISGPVMFWVRWFSVVVEPTTYPTT